MPFLERDAQLEQLETLLARARVGEGAVATVTGEAGIGKTTLLRRFARRAGVRTLWGGCDELFTPRPLGPLHDMSSLLGSELRELLAGNDRAALFRELQHELRAATSLLVVEDVHWADEATLDLIRYLGRRIRELPCLMALTFRDEEIGRGMQRVAGDLARAGARRIRLQPLSAAAVASLASDTPHAPERLHLLTGGNPFFLTELLASHGDEVPVSVRDAVLARLARLSAEARATLEQVAVVPSRAEAWLVEGEIDACVTGGCCGTRSRISRSGTSWPAARWRTPFRRSARGNCIAPYWPSLPCACRTRSPASSIMRTAAATRRPCCATRRPRRSRPRGWARIARRRRTTRAPCAELLRGTAATPRHCTSATPTSATSPIRSRRGSPRGGRRSSCGGRRGTRSARATTCAGSRACSGSPATAQGRRRAPMSPIRELEPLGPSPSLAMAWSNRAQLHMLAGEVEETLRLGEQSVAFARAAGDMPIVAHALNNIGTALWHDAQTARGRAALEESLEIALRHGLEEHVARAYTNLASYVSAVLSKLGVRSRTEAAAALARLEK